ncbi:MAG TPA: hypothetical protein VL282_11050, partial [Tepidisphaeraceae bacterium]|nr:hypothetical protein [Tepidisphaeraceae bacterium]
RWTWGTKQFTFLQAIAVAACGFADERALICEIAKRSPHRQREPQLSTFRNAPSPRYHAL